jgi:hypothetical protein
MPVKPRARGTWPMKAPLADTGETRAPAGAAEGAAPGVAASTPGGNALGPAPSC